MRHSDSKIFYMLGPNAHTPKQSREHARQQRKSLIARGGAHCAVCGFHDRTEGNMLHVHHIIAVSRGGHGGRSNLIVLCSNCHTAVHTFGNRKFYYQGSWFKAQRFNEQVKIVMAHGYLEPDATRIAMIASQDVWTDGHALRRFSTPVVEPVVDVEPSPCTNLTIINQAVGD